VEGSHHISRRDLLRLALAASSLPIAPWLVACAAQEDDGALPSPTSGGPPESASTDVPAPTSDPLLDGLGELVTPLDTVEPVDEFGDLRSLAPLLSGASIVGLGEATHGTHEFFTLKHRLIRFLVKELGFTRLAVELPWSMAAIYDDYIESNAELEAVIASPYAWTWKTQETVDMLNWLREHNTGLEPARRVRLYGIDPQLSVEAGTRSVLEFVVGVDAPAVAEFERLYANATNEDETTWAEALIDAELAFETLAGRREQYASSSSAEAFEEAVHAARIVVQTSTVRTARLEDPSTALALRDEYMAENAVRLLNQGTGDERIVLWAHNQHVFTVRLADAPGSPMGLHLREALGDAYAVIGFDFAVGGFTARTASTAPATTPAPSPVEAQTIEAAPQDSYAATFEQLAPDAFILNLRDLDPASPVADWLSDPHPVWSVGAVFNPPHSDGFTIALPLTDSFDALVFVRETTPSMVVPEA
jgi:erythromycin esterase